MRSFPGLLHLWLLVPAAFGLLIFVSGCGSRSTPPGWSKISGSDSDSGMYFTFLQWKEGPMLLLVDDVKGFHNSEGGGHTGPQEGT